MVLRPRSRRTIVLAFAAVTLLGAGTAIASEAPTHPGPRPDSTALTSVGWTVTPAGTQHRLGVFPVNSIWTPGHEALIVAHGSGYGPGLQVVDPASGAVLQSISGAVSAGIAFNHDDRDLRLSSPDCA